LILGPVISHPAFKLGYCLEEILALTISEGEDTMILNEVEALNVHFQALARHAAALILVVVPGATVFVPKLRTGTIGHALTLAVYAFVAEFLAFPAGAATTIIAALLAVTAGGAAASVYADIVWWTTGSTTRIGASTCAVLANLVWWTITAGATAAILTTFRVCAIRFAFALSVNAYPMLPTTTTVSTASVVAALFALARRYARTRKKLDQGPDSPPIHIPRKIVGPTWGRRSRAVHPVVKPLWMTDFGDETATYHRLEHADVEVVLQVTTHGSPVAARAVASAFVTTSVKTVLVNSIPSPLSTFCRCAIKSSTAGCPVDVGTGGLDEATCRDLGGPAFRGDAALEFDWQVPSPLQPHPLPFLSF